MSTPTTTKTTECIEACNTLLLGERSAVAAYQSAADKFPGQPISGDLLTMCETHRDSVDLLESSIREMGGEPEVGPVNWGVHANAIQQTPRLYGSESAVENLKNCEKDNEKSYDDVLENRALLPESEALLKDTLLPRVVKHIKTLEQIEQSAN